ncbi:MAG: hypothetical protein EZS28_019607 [Streblomastix strix]|uniref:SPRY domain-containing protein n=1 Tax=Streblomastix strix TaxID=222440 RepID=A0A5J4VRI1_9EUKA|nr:MAG: hypothetical protein EZS28_019607 [Streblomastix strix]
MVKIYDTNIIFILPVSSEKSIIGFDPESDRTQINSQTPSDPVQQQIPIPPNAQQSDNLISLQQMSFVQPDVIRGAQIQQNVIVPKSSSKQQPKPVPKIQQIQRQVTSSPQSITVNLEVPSGMPGHKDENGFIHDNTVEFCIGIADSSVVFQPNKWPNEDGNDEKTENYWSDYVSNQGFRCGQRIGAEVNMISRSRRLVFFVDDVEQKYQIINIPEAIRFWSLIQYPNSSFRVTRFERCSSSSAHGVTGSYGLEWGKKWHW